MIWIEDDEGRSIVVVVVVRVASRSRRQRVQIKRVFVLMRQLCVPGEVGGRPCVSQTHHSRTLKTRKDPPCNWDLLDKKQESVYT